MPSAKPVLISGAGLGGLLLAQALRKHDIPFLIYERDPTGSSRSQGYRIRLTSYGLEAISNVLTPEEYNDFLTGCTATGPGKISPHDAFTLKPKESNFAPPPRGGGETMGVARGWVRASLFRGIEEAVSFSKHIVSYELIGSSGVVVRFADGTASPEGRMLVAADGVYSKITKQLTGGALKVYDTGARMIHGSSPKATFDELARGRFGAFSVEDDSYKNESGDGGHVAMITNVRDERGDNVHFGWVLIGAQGTIDPPGDDFSLTGRPAVDICLRVTEKWSPLVRPIFTEQAVAEAAFLRVTTSSPDGVPLWPNQPRVTLLGDAVHAMTPAGGVGANTALRDAGLLGRLIAARGGWRDGLTKEYEDEMRVYASQSVSDSWERIKKQYKIEKLERTL